MHRSPLGARWPERLRARAAFFACRDRASPPTVFLAVVCRLQVSSAFLAPLEGLAEGFLRQPAPAMSCSIKPAAQDGGKRPIRHMAVAPRRSTLPKPNPLADAEGRMKSWPSVIRALFPGVLLVALVLPARAAPGTPAPPARDVAMPRPEQVMAVPPALRDALLRHAGDAQTQNQRLQRLAEFLYSEDGLALRYAHDATHTVADAYRTRLANCLTFSLLTVALARELGLEAYGQEVDDVLSWYQEGDTVYRNNHVNAGVRIGMRRLTVDVASDEVIARRAPREVDDVHLLAMFYNNQAVELSARGHAGAAAERMAMSLRLSPAYAASRSNAGVLQLRAGDLAAAERDYLAALELDAEFAPALLNLVSLYERTGNRARSTAYRSRLERVRRDDPFHHFLAALEYERRGEYALAADRYRRAIRLHGGEHRFHFALARMYLHLGDARRAGRALRRAHELGDDRSRALYQAKLDRLRRSR